MPRFPIELSVSMYLNYPTRNTGQVTGSLRRFKESHKFMQVLDQGVYQQLQSVATQKGVTVQELIRVIVIPEWLDRLEEGFEKKELERRHRRVVRKLLRPARVARATVRLPRGKR